MKTLTIITGASKGLGFELTRQSLKVGDTVVTMERRPSKALVEEADKIGCNFIQFTADLLDRKGAVELLMWLLSDKEYAEHDRLILINNAGVLGPVGPIENASPQVAVDCIRVNFEIPVLLTQAFLNETRSWKGERRVMNISSAPAASPFRAGPCTVQPKQRLTALPPSQLKISLANPIPHALAPSLRAL